MNYGKKASRLVYFSSSIACSMLRSGSQYRRRRYCLILAFPLAVTGNLVMSCRSFFILFSILSCHGDFFWSILLVFFSGCCFRCIAVAYTYQSRLNSVVLQVVISWMTVGFLGPFAYGRHVVLIEPQCASFSVVLVCVITCTILFARSLRINAWCVDSCSDCLDSRLLIIRIV